MISWAWAFEKSSSYTVRSAYHSLITHNAYHSLMTHNKHTALEEGTVIEASATERQLWSRLWKLKILPKVRVFWWRVLRGILPVEATLKYRHISTVSTCKICQHEDENMMHALPCKRILGPSTGLAWGQATWFISSNMVKRCYLLSKFLWVGMWKAGYNIVGNMDFPE